MQTKKNHLAVVFFLQVRITWQLPKQQVQQVQQVHQQRGQQQERERVQELALLFCRRRPKQQPR